MKGREEGTFTDHRDHSTTFTVNYCYTSLITVIIIFTLQWPCVNLLPGQIPLNIYVMDLMKKTF